MPRLTALRASGVIEEELARVGCRFDSSTAPPHDTPRSEARDEHWWLGAGSIGEDPYTSRNRALLRGYLRVASGDDSAAPAPLYADGLRLDRGKSLHMDRSVMARLLKAGLVAFDTSKPGPPVFVVTDTGHAFLAD